MKTGFSFLSQGLVLAAFTLAEIMIALVILMVVFSGILSVLLGLMIVAHWPYSSFYVLGIFLGVDLIIIGTTWLSMGFALRRKA